MGSLLHDVSAIFDTLSARNDAGYGTLAGDVADAINNRGVAFCRDPAVFHFLTNVGDDAPAPLQCGWTALRVFMAHCPHANVTGIGVVEEQWKIDSVWPRTHDVREVVWDPPEDADGVPLELAVPEVHRGGPVRLAQLRRLLGRPEGPPYMKLTLNDAVTYYVSLRPFKLTRVDMPFLIPSVKMAGLHWISF